MTSQVPSRKPDEHDAKRKRSDGPITLRDVAEQAGVSVSTVSLVLNAKANARIGQKTREQVIATAETLGYRPNALAKSLVRGSSKRSEEHTSELQSRGHLVCRLLLEKKKK